MYKNEIRVIRTMNSGIILSIRQYCEIKGIPWRYKDDGINPYEISIKTDERTFEFILSVHAIRSE